MFVKWDSNIYKILLLFKLIFWSTTSPDNFQRQLSCVRSTSANVSENRIPLNKRRKSNIYRTFRGRPGRALDVLCTFNLRPVSKELVVHVMRCAIWYHLYNLKNVKNTHGGVLLFVKLQTKPATLLVKVTLLYGCSSRFFKFYKWCQIAQHINSHVHTRLTTFHVSWICLLWTCFGIQFIFCGTHY